MSNTSRRQRRDQRDNALDIAKGMAAIMIVMGHVLRGLSAAHDLNPREGWYVYSDRLLYLVHLPTFIFISGLFVTSSLRRAGRSTYLRSRLISCLWLYGLWTLLQGSVKVLTSAYVNAPLTPMGVLKEYIEPTSQLWYFPMLMLFTGLVVLANPLRFQRFRLFVALAFAITLLTWGRQGHFVGTAGWSLVFYFFIGTFLGHQQVREHTQRLGRALPFVASATVSVFAVLGLKGQPLPPTDPTLPITPRTVLEGFLASSVAVGAVILVATAIRRNAVGLALAKVGTYSLQIFVAHVTFTSALRIVLDHLGVHSIPIEIVTGVLAGVLAPIVLALVCNRPRLRWVFEAPSRLRAGVTMSTPR